MGILQTFFQYRLLLALTPAFVLLHPVAAMPPASTAGDNEPLHTRISLLADVATVRPGGEFTVGVLMKMDPGWHTYWRNPGEAGLPTRVTWTLPEGITAGTILWPAPHKYNESGDVLTYGYADENMLLVPMRAVAGIRPGASLTLKAEVTWLECERICIPGRKTVELTLPVRDETPAAANAGLFARYLKELPLPEGRGVVIEGSTGAQRAVVHIAPRDGKRLEIKPGVLPDFYPEELDTFQVGRTTVDATPDRAILRIPLTVDEPVVGARVLKGLLVYALEGGSRTVVEYAVPLPADFVRTLSAGTESETGESVLDREFSTVRSGGGDQPLLLYLLFALIGGLLLNIMPCVLPAISLKVFGFVRMAGDAPRQVKRHGLAFAAGILASFLALAVIVIILRSAGEHVGWGFQFQEPLFVIAMSTIVFAFGLSLFGVFEAGLLFMIAFAGVGSALERQARDGTGYVASFWEGIFATILATPCTAPFLGTALGFAFSQPAFLTLLVFCSVGLGMALPYVVLTSRPGWMRFLPKPGAWMETAKQFMGFLMMGTLIWLLYVLGKQLGMEGVVWTSAFLLVVGMGCWLVGRFATLSASRRTFIITWSASLVLVVAAYVLFIDPTLEAGNVLARDSEQSSTDAGIRWEPFTVQRLDGVLQENKTVFIDFTAEWCLTCKVNEKTVLASAEVIRAFDERGIVPLKADWTNRNPEITQLLAKFGRSGVPLYVIFPAGNPGAPIVLPEVITTGIVIEALERAAPHGA